MVWHCVVKQCITKHCNAKHGIAQRHRTQHCGDDDEAEEKENLEDEEENVKWDEDV